MSLPSTPVAGRRRALKLLGGVGATALFVGRLRAAPTAPAACAAVATETAGPFPADGSRFGPPPGMGPGMGPGFGPGPGGPGFGPGGSPPFGPPPGGAPPPGGVFPGGTGAPVDLLNVRLVRADIRADADGANPRPGIPLRLDIAVTDAHGCGPLAGAWVYVWHCSRDGQYSGYPSAPGSEDVSRDSFLRGVQQTDARGRVSFTTVYPGRYEGRATHVHAAVFPADAAPGFDADAKLVTTQFAFPDATNNAAYATESYAANRRRGVPVNARDGIFADGTDTELLTVEGNPEQGFVARIAIAVASPAPVAGRPTGVL